MPDTEALDRDDMRRLAAGEDAALDRLMERHATPVFHFLVRMLDNEDDASDLAQETFVRVYRARDGFREEARFTTWLYTIAANLGRNEYRRRSRHPATSLDAASGEDAQPLSERVSAPGHAPDTALLVEERQAAVRAAVHQLPEEMREALVLCEWENLSMAEAAAVLGTTAKAVEARLYRGRKLLRERLARWL